MRGLSVFELDDERAGFDVGQALLKAGHRRSCFVGTEGTDFGELRLAGLRRSFGIAGHRDGISAIWAPADMVVRQKQARGLCAQDREDLEAADHQVHTLVAIEHRAEDQALSPEQRRVLGGNIRQQLFLTAYRRCYLPVMRAVLAIPGITGLVTADDNIALSGVLPFLKRAGIQVPKDVSVVSFNGSFEAQQAGLSSYQFDIAGMVMRMLDSVLSPLRKPSVIQGSRLFPVTGVCIRRPSLGETTSKPAAAGE